MKRFGDFTLDLERRTLYRNGRALALSGKAFDLLAILVASPGRAFSREELYNQLWPSEIVEDGNLTQNIYLLRRTLDAGCDGESCITTIPRFGYRFEPGVDAVSRPARRAIRFPVRRIALALSIVLALVSSSGLVHARLPQRAIEAQALGEYHLNLRGPGDLRTAFRYFSSAIAEAPNDAGAYAWAASALALSAEYLADGSNTQQHTIARAEQYVHEAFIRDPRNSRALAVAGFISYRFRNDYVGARRFLQEAIAADPDNATAHLWYGVVLLASRDIAGATHQFEVAHAQQPTSEVFSRWLARAYTLGGRPDDAIAAAHEALRIVPDDAEANLALASAEEMRGRFGDALQVMRSLAARDPYEAPYLIPSEARIRHLMHESAAVSSGKRLDPFETALFYVSIGQQHRAAALLRAAKRSELERALEAYDPRLQRFALDGELRQLLEVTG